MSIAVEIKLSESRTETIHVKDGVTSHLNLLDIGGWARTNELLAENLESRDFQKGEDGIFRRVDNDVTIEVNPEKREVTAKISSSSDVQNSVETSIRADRDFVTEEEIQRRLNEKAQKALDTRLQEMTDKLQKEISDKLEAKLGELRGELDEITKRVTQKALLEKARSMGVVTDVSEQGDTMTIKVQV